MPGWKVRIGYLSPSVFEIPSEWNLILPPGFTLVASGLNVQAHTAEEFDKAVDALESTLNVFAAEEVDAIILGGITLGTQRGFRAEQEIVSSLSQRLNLPITTGMNASAEALKHLKTKSIVVATAYKEHINEAVRRYFEDAGLGVLGIAGLEVSRPVEQVKLPEYAAYRVARKLLQENPNTDAILVHGRWHSVAYIEELERDTGRPVVATVAACLWWVFQTLGVKHPIEGYGQLLRQEEPASLFARKFKRI